ncbi:MAG: hypothetical protein ABR525_06865 [Candidatus Limnocylindria bacterium]
MPSEEGKQVLRLLAEGKIDAEQAYRLLRALGDIADGQRPAAADAPRAQSGGGADIPPGLRGRILRIQVMSGNKSKVNIAIPVAVARLGKMKIAASGLVREHLSKFGIDLDDVLRSIERAGPLVDIHDNEDRILITVE